MKSVNIVPSIWYDLVTREPEFIERANRFWRVGQVYRSKFFPHEYFKVIAVGDEQVYGCEYLVDVKEPWNRLWYKLRGRKYRKTANVCIQETDKNKFFFGWTPVDHVPAINDILTTCTYQYRRHTSCLDIYDAPEDMFKVGNRLRGNFFGSQDEIYTILGVGVDSIFVQFEVKGKIIERARTKRAGAWRKM